LPGRWLSLEELGTLDVFKSGKSATEFRRQFNRNFEVTAGDPAPWLKAAVWREYAPGEVICEAGTYGSTAFVIVNGTASVALPEHTVPRPITGRTRQALAHVQRMFQRRTPADHRAPDAVAVGEVSAYATAGCDRPPLPAMLGPGDVFGIDACINFYPREATVRAQEPCVVVEMLRSVLDTIRLAGAAGDGIDTGYAAAAICNQLSLSSVFRDLTGEQLDRLAQDAELLTNDSDAVHGDVICREGDAADAMYLVRAGTIKISQHKAGGELIFSYLGRGAAFGLEALLPGRESTALVLRCASHPGEIPDVEISGTVTVGRSAACEVKIPKEARAVSRRHCRVQVRGEDLYLVDLDSDNGTQLNGEPIREAIVVAGDLITIVDYTFELKRIVRDAMTTPVARPRGATATGLDNFEVVKISTAAVLRVTAENERFRESAQAAARAFEASAAQRPASEQSLVDTLVELNLYNSQNVLLIDLDRCTRCDECVKACATAHDGVARFTRDGPRFGQHLVTMACRSCTDPKCMIGCPVGSIRRKDSLEIHIEDCASAANAAPRSVRSATSTWSSCRRHRYARRSRPCAPRCAISVRASMGRTVCMRAHMMRPSASIPERSCQLRACGLRDRPRDLAQPCGAGADCMRINADHTRWAVTTIAISAAAAALYAYETSTSAYGVSGGSRLGLTFGITGTSCMVLAGLLAARKTVSTWRIGSAFLWMKMHLWLGLLAVPLILFHSGFRFGGPLTACLMVLFYLVIASGVFGLILQQFIPALMRARVPLETVRGQIDYVLAGLAVDAYELVASVAGVIPEATEEQARLAAEDELQKRRPTNWKQIVRQRPAPEPSTIGTELKAVYLAAVRPYLRSGAGTKPPDLRRFMVEAPELRGKLERIQNLCEESRQLREQLRLHTLLHNWLFVHAPLSFALFVLAGFHIYFALRY